VKISSFCCGRVGGGRKKEKGEGGKKKEMTALYGGLYYNLHSLSTTFTEPDVRRRKGEGNHHGKTLFSIFCLGFFSVILKPFNK